MKKLGSSFRDMVERIKNKYTPEKIILYGSFAYGHPDRNSDIDLLIIKDTSERPIDRRVRVRRIADIKDSSYPAFSPIVLTTKELNRRLQIGDQFVEEIISKGKVLYAK